MSKNELAPTTNKALSVFEDLATCGLDTVKAPTDASSWLPELKFAWPVQNLVDADGKPFVNRLYLGDKSTPDALKAGDIIVPISARDAVQYTKRIVRTDKRGKDQKESKDFYVGLANGERKGDDYKRALARAAEGGLVTDMPVDDPKFTAQKQIEEINEGHSYLVAILRNGGCAFAEFQAFRSMAKAMYPSMVNNGLGKRTGLQLVADDLGAMIDEYEGNKFPSKRKVPLALRVVELTPEMLQMIPPAAEAAAAEIADWRKK